MGLTDIFTQDAKVVISPDEMRAWVMLPPPPKGQKYTSEAIAAWLPEWGVVHGARDNMIRAAVAGEKYHELLEVARGDDPVPPVPGGYTLRIEKKPFTGLKGNPDGSLFYDDLSFLQEVTKGQVLADIHPEKPGAPGRSVTGQEVPPPEVQGGETVSGSGYEVNEDGSKVIAPGLGHVNILNEQLVVTPLLKLEKLESGAAPLEFDGNILIEGNVESGTSIKATGSIFVAGRASDAAIEAGRNVLLCGGMRSEKGVGTVKAKENIWGLNFEMCDLQAGKDICANHLISCQAKAAGRGLILGGKGQVAGTTLAAKEGIVAAVLGDQRGTETVVSSGMDAELIDRFEGVKKRLEKLNADIQNLGKNITAHENVNRGKADKGKNDPAYKEMVQKRDQMLNVLKLVEGERVRLKRVMDAFSATSVIARQAAYPGLEVSIDTRTMNVDRPLQRVKFKRDGDVLEVVAAASDR